MCLTTKRYGCSDQVDNIVQRGQIIHDEQYLYDRNTTPTPFVHSKLFTSTSVT